MWAQSYPKFIKKIFLFVYCFFTNILLILCLIPRLSFAIEITQDNIHFIQDFKLMMFGYSSFSSRLNGVIDGTCELYRFYLMETQHLLVH